MLKAIADSNIRNYTIFLKEPENILFAYWEYHGSDFDADMKKMADAPRMKEWWAITDPMQVPFETREGGRVVGRHGRTSFTPAEALLFAADACL